MPAPAIMTVRERTTGRASRRAISGDGRFRQRALRRPRGMGIEAWIVTIKRRAIGADDLVRVAQVEEHVRVVERRLLADAHKLMGTDFDDRHAWGVVEMGNDRFRHVSNPPSRA